MTTKKLNKFSTFIFVMGVLLLIMLINFYIRLNSKNYIEENNVNNDLYLRKVKADLQKLKGDKISFIKEVFIDIENSKENPNYLFIYHSGDCKGCIIQGKNLINRIKQNPVYTFWLSDDSSDECFYRTKYKTRDKNVYYYLEKFGYIQTPVIIQFDSSFTVVDGFFPGLESINKFENFINLQ